MPGAKPGERRGGRKKGVPNKLTSEVRAEVKALAQKYAPAALKELGRLSVEAESEQARVAASKEILDRAYGKATQPVSGDADADPLQVQASIEVSFVGSKSDKS